MSALEVNRARIFMPEPEGGEGWGSHFLVKGRWMGTRFLDHGEIRDPGTWTPSKEGGEGLEFWFSKAGAFALDSYVTGSWGLGVRTSESLTLVALKPSGEATGRCRDTGAEC